MKKPIGVFTGNVAPTGKPTPAVATCANCKFLDPNKLDGATKALCMRYPRQILMRVSDWCGEHQMK